MFHRVSYIYPIVFLLISLSIYTACNDTVYVQGQRLYAAKCQNCHMEDGSGLQSLIPPLSTSAKLGSLDIVCILVNGVNDTIFKDSTFLVKEMPSFKSLSATELANVVNYINSRWYPEFKEFKITDITNQANQCL